MLIFLWMLLCIPQQLGSSPTIHDSDIDLMNTTSLSTMYASGSDTLLTSRQPSLYFAGRSCLALAAIPLTMSLLQYMSINKDIGELVIMLINMWSDLKSFFWLFLLCTVGFATTLQSLYSQSTENDSFGSTSLTTFTLFTAATGTFDLTGTFDESSSMGLLGIWILIVYVTFIPIVLVNLLIARMGSTHERVNEKAVEEHAFLKAKTVSQFVLFYEKNATVMLPPPLNLLLVPLMPLHFYMQRKQGVCVSVCGSVSNIILW